LTSSPWPTPQARAQAGSGDLANGLALKTHPLADDMTSVVPMSSLLKATLSQAKTL